MVILRANARADFRSWRAAAAHSSRRGRTAAVFLEVARPLRPRDGLRSKTDDRGAAAAAAVAAVSSFVQASPKRCSHSDAPLYILRVIIHTKYTGVRQNDSNV